MMKYLQKLGKALMLPVAALPICGILMGVGYFLAPAAMGAEGPTEGLAYTAGFILIKAGGALIDNMAWLFAVGAAVGLSDDHDGTAALAGLVSYLMMTQLLSTGVVGAIMTLEEGSSTFIAFQKTAGNAFIGILAAIIGSTCYNKFKNTQLPDWLAFFSGKRCVAIVTGVVSIVVSVILLFVWPLIFNALVALGDGIVGLGGIGAGLYAFFNRLLIPTGLHHALNNVFWFDTIGIGDLSNYWAGYVTGDIGTNGEVIDWSLGMYMSGFFPCMMFGIPGAALAMVHTAKNKKAAIGLVTSAAICAFVCGVTEPFEFGFMFLCFPLYVVYALLYAIFAVITYYVGFRAGFMFSAGGTDLLFSASLPAHANTWMIIPLGIAAFVIFYVVFRFAITKFNLTTPGREDEDTDAAEANITLANNDFTAIASGVLAAIGGKGNVANVDYCATRLRFEVKDSSAVDEKAVKAAGAAGVIRPSKNACQVVIGPKVQFVYDELKKML
ncbi:MAG TPA: PTS transporter subunit EIIC [Candidatus Gemmiger avistercoris]|uniref:PTS transporter subunit EIIC n=3 Tax=Eubacteriales TaxID=186802 RepID=A0A9D2FJM6_9FIRM|nr:PTS transporter subunit EIIC [uncultured Subdoligranulum sp.]HIZ61782.1 PTS transporter subunit EIIC [Candidatus Gemmiger avistercoris]